VDCLVANFRWGYVFLVKSNNLFASWIHHEEPFEDSQRFVAIMKQTYEQEINDTNKQSK